MFWRKMSVLALLFACGATSAWAQRQYEITPFWGSRFGGVINLTSSSSSQGVDFLTIRSSMDYGAVGDVSLFPNFYAEFMWNRQPTTLSAHNFITDTITPLTTANLDMYQFSALYEFRDPEAKLKPFVVAGLGFTHFGQAHPAVSFSNRFAYNISGGVKYFFTKYFGLRLDVRYSPTQTTSSQAVVCDPFFGCFNTTVHNYAKQGQANLGLIFRF